jgi:hypothetical protein
VSHEASISVLYKDLPRTFAELGFFHNGGPLEQPLREVLESYIFFRPDVGYVQGMSFIAAMLLLYVEPFEAFVCFSNMMNSAHFLPFYSMDLQHIHAYVLLAPRFLMFAVTASFAHFVAVFCFVYLKPPSSATLAHSSTSSNCTSLRFISTLVTWTCR